MREHANASGSYVDPLTGKVVQTDERLAADHIVPKNWIKQQPGFDQLTPAQQSAILNDPINTQGLPTSFNSSKGAKMPGIGQRTRASHWTQDILRVALNKLRQSGAISRIA